MSIIKNLDMVEDLFILHSGEENNATGENGNVFRLNIARMNEEQRSTWCFLGNQRMRHSQEKITKMNHLLGGSIKDLLRITYDA